MLERCFIIITAVYLFYAGYQGGIGHYYKLICPKYVRWICNNLINTAFESAIIVSIMYLHYKCAQIH